jgi:hypothetical protein
MPTLAELMAAAKAKQEAQTTKPADHKTPSFLAATQPAAHATPATTTIAAPIATPTAAPITMPAPAQMPAPKPGAFAALVAKSFAAQKAPAAPARDVLFGTGFTKKIAESTNKAAEKEN